MYALVSYNCLHQEVTFNYYTDLTVSKTDKNSQVQGQSPWSGGQGGEAPLKLKAFWSLDVQRSRQI